LNIKDTLEKKLGKLDEEAVAFAVSQFEGNSRQISMSRKMTDADALDEMSMNIDFYYRYLKGGDISEGNISEQTLCNIAHR
jgi:hypothetical protein